VKPGELPRPEGIRHGAGNRWTGRKQLKVSNFSSFAVFIIAVILSAENTGLYLKAGIVEKYNNEYISVSYIP
jgi:hypothetical protein